MDLVNGQTGTTPETQHSRRVWADDETFHKILNYYKALAVLDNFNHVPDDRLKKEISAMRRSLGADASCLRFNFGVEKRNLLPPEHRVHPEDLHRLAQVATIMLRALQRVEVEATQRGFEIPRWQNRKHVNELVKWYATENASTLVM